MLLNAVQLQKRINERLRWCWKVDNLDAVGMLEGKLFHAKGPATQNARLSGCCGGKVKFVHFCVLERPACAKWGNYNRICKRLIWRHVTVESERNSVSLATNSMLSINGLTQMPFICGDAPYGWYYGWRLRQSAGMTRWMNGLYYKNKIRFST